MMPSTTRATTDLAGRLADAGPLVQQRPDDVVDELAEIACHASRTGDPELAGDSWYLAARACVNLGRLDDALEAIDAAHRQFTTAGRPMDAARTGLGRMNVLDDLGRHRDAIDVGRRLLAELVALADVSDETGHARLSAAALENIGVSNGLLGHHEEALEAYAHAEHQYLAAGLESDAARCGANRGVELFDLGRSDEAIAALRSARPDLEADGDLQFAGLCAAFEAGAHVQRGDFLEAHRLLVVSDGLLADGDATTDWARAQLVRAETLLALNLQDEAADLYERLEVRFERAGQRRDRAVAILGRARILLRTKRPTAAADGFVRAETEFAEIGDEAMRAASLLGRSYAGDDRTRMSAALGALRSFENSGRRPDEVIARLRLIDLDPASAEVHLSRCGEIMDDVDLPHLEWKVLRSRARRSDDPAVAFELLNRAAVIVEQLRTTVTDDISLVPFMGSRRDVHEDLVDLHLAAHEPARALACISAARSRTLTEQASSPVSASEVAPFGPTTARIVFEMIGDEVLALSTIGGELSVTRDLTDAVTLERLLRRLDAQWRRFRPDVLAGADARSLMVPTLDLLEQIHRLLIAPIEHLHDVGEVRELVVVPVGLMANVPFPALFDGARHLIERFPVTVAASLEHATRHRRSGSTRLVVGVGDARAPMVAAEVDAIARDSPNTTTLVDRAATARAIGSAARDHDIIHIACHGHNRADNPELSALRVADRELTAREIAGYDLDGQLVVLSACSSGRQHVAGNVDELLGLPRAFLAAGASSVVVNLWPVDDTSASELMVEFHRRLASEGPRDALRNTQLAMLAGGIHPYHWAPTVMYVAGAALSIEQPASESS